MNYYFRWLFYLKLEKYMDNSLLKDLNRYYHLFDKELYKSLRPFLEIATLSTQSTVAYVSVFDDLYQYFISSFGFESEPVLRKKSLCNHTLNQNSLLVIEDLNNDQRVISKSYEAYGYYVGYPIKNKKKVVLGTFCILGSESRKISERERKIINLLGLEIVEFMERRKNMIRFYQNWIEMNRIRDEEFEQLEDTKSKLAHDLRGPVGNLQNIAKLAIERKEDHEALTEFIEVFEQNSSHVNKILSDLLNELNNQKSDKLKPDEETDVDQIISSITEFNDFSSTYGDFEIIKDNLPTINASSTDIFLVFQNLIENALKYNQEKEKRIEIIGNQSGNTYEIYISDNGIGIPEEFHKKVFEKKSRVYYEKEGSGLGLYNVKKILDKYQARIKIAKSDTKGTTFIIYWNISE